jgi:adenylate cyclase
MNLGIRYCSASADSSRGGTNYDTWGAEFRAKYSHAAQLVQVPWCDDAVRGGAIRVNTSKPKHRLAAILAADAAGYSSLMASDDHATVLALDAARAVFREEIESNQGRVIDMAGDSVLAVFEAATGAVTAALAIQAAINLLADAAPDDRRMRFRIGIHLGDVIEKTDGTVYGDGVNIAARLEGLAEPGGITISDSVRLVVKGKVSAGFEDQGEQTIKNIPDPVRAYRVSAQSAVPTQPAPTSAEIALSLPDKPSIAVLPFANMSGDPEQEYFTDGITEDLLTGLARMRWLFVIARNSSFLFRGADVDVTEAGQRLGVRYIIGGTVRKAGSKLRITSHLLDAISGAHLWAERYDRNLVDIFALQDEITASVLAVIEPAVRKAEIERIKRKRPADLGAYDCYLRALAHMFDPRAEGRTLALKYVDQALAKDPNYAEAHGVAAWCYFAKSLWEGSMPANHLAAMLHHGRAVQSLQTEDAGTLAHAAIALALATRDYAASLAMIDRAIAMNPSSAHAHGHGSVVCTWAGLCDKSIALSEQALRLSPFDPLSVMPLAGQAGAHLLKADYAKGLAFAHRALQVYPNHTPSLLIIIVCMMRLQRQSEAVAVARDFATVFPAYRIIPDAPVLGLFVDELQAAGLPLSSPHTPSS